MCSQKTNNAKAFLLVQNHGYQASQLVNEKLASWAGLDRAKKSHVKGYNMGEPGNRQKLCDDDEVILVSWILELIDRGYTVYTGKVLAMVCKSSLANTDCRISF